MQRGALFFVGWVFNGKFNSLLVVALLRQVWPVPFADEEQRREYMRDYHAEFRVGLKD